MASSPTALLTRTLYRHLLRAARSFDSRPALLSLLTLQAPVGAMGAQAASADPSASKLNAVPLMSYSATDAASGGGVAGTDKQVGVAISLVSDAFQEWLEPPARMFPPATPGQSALPMPLYQFVRSRVRAEAAASQGMPPRRSDLAALYVATKTLQHVQTTAEAEAARPQAAVPLFPRAVTDSLRPLRPSGTLRPNCLMVEHPSILAPGRALLLIFDISRNIKEHHGDEDWVVRCYAVNRPFPQTVAQMTGRKDLGPFGDLMLFHGGPDGHGQLSIIHCHGDIPGAQAIDPDAVSADSADAGDNGDSTGSGNSGASTTGTMGMGTRRRHLYVGGDVTAINAALQEGRAKAEDFKVVMGHTALKLASTSPAGSSAEGGGTEGEEGSLALPDEDAWWLAESAGDDNGNGGIVDYCLLPAQFDTTGQFRDGKGLGVNDRVEGYNHARFWHQNGAWSAAVRAMAASLQSAHAGAEETSDAGRWAKLLHAAGRDSLLHPAVAHHLASTLPLPISLPPVLTGGDGSQ